MTPNKAAKAFWAEFWTTENNELAMKGFIDPWRDNWRQIWGPKYRALMVKTFGAAKGSRFADEMDETMAPAPKEIAEQEAGPRNPSM